MRGLDAIGWLLNWKSREQIVLSSVLDSFQLRRNSSRGHEWPTVLHIFDLVVYWIERCLRIRHKPGSSPIYQEEC